MDRPPSDGAHALPDTADAVSEFVSEVAVVAGSIDPMLAVILGSNLTPVPDRKRWTKGRRNGLEFCLVMLGYARGEAACRVDARRIDRAMSYIVLEFARLQHAQRVASAI